MSTQIAEKTTIRIVGSWCPLVTGNVYMQMRDCNPLWSSGESEWHISIIHGEQVRVRYVSWDGGFIREAEVWIYE